MEMVSVAYWVWYAGVVFLILEDLRHPNAGVPGMIILNQRQVYIAILLWPLIVIFMVILHIVDRAGLR